MLKNILNKNNDFYDSKIGLIFQALFTNFMLKPYYTLFFKTEVHGKNNIPKDRTLLFAPNHGSYHDPPLLAAATEMHMAYMAKKELFDVPVLSQLISALSLIHI